MFEALGRGIGYALIKSGKWWIVPLIIGAIYGIYYLCKWLKERFGAENRTHHKIDKELNELRKNKTPKITFTDSFKCPSCGGITQISVPSSRYICNYCGARLEEVDKRIHDMTLDAKTKYEHDIKDLYLLKDKTTKRFSEDRQIRIEEEKIRNEKRKARNRMITLLLECAGIFLFIYFIIRLTGLFDSLRSLFS